MLFNEKMLESNDHGKWICSIHYKLTVDGLKMFNMVDMFMYVITCSGRNSEENSDLKNYINTFVLINMRTRNNRDQNQLYENTTSTSFE